MDTQAIVSCATKGGNQAWVDVDDAIFIGIGDAFVQNDQKPCKHHQINLVAFEERNELFAIHSRGHVLCFWQNSGGNILLLGSCEGVSVFLIAHHQGKLTTRDLTCLACIEQRLQVCPPSADKYRNV